jgi:hypothetical protein
MNGENEIPLQEILNVRESFVLPVGTPLQVEIEGVTVKMNSLSIGYVADDYLIVKHPVTGSIGSIASKLYPGNKITVRYVTGGDIFAFQSELIGATEAPVRLILVAYPTLIVRHSLRKDRRLDCHLSAEMWKNRTTKDVIDDATHEGIIVDISRSGCSFDMRTDSSRVSSEFSVNEAVTLGVRFPGTESKVELSTEVKRIKRDNQRTNVGLQFRDICEDGKNAVTGYILAMEKFSFRE